MLDPMKITLPIESKLSSPDFIFGVATSSFQIEGNSHARLPSIWDEFCKQPDAIKDHSDGQIACDHCNNWRQDIKLINFLDVDAYRLSIAWGRVMQADGSLNQQGVNFYIKLLDELNLRNIKPFVTLYHWDLPQFIEDNGGWLNRDTAFYFQDYVDQISQAFGDRVYAYATLNEPFCSAYLGYEVGIHAPGKTGVANGRTAAHHLLLAHGLAMQTLKKNSPNSLNGIVLNFTPCTPYTDTAADKAAANMADEYMNQWYLKPLLDKSYPAVIETLSEKEKPPIHACDMDIIATEIDFLGVNFYTRNIVQACDKDNFKIIEPNNCELTDMGWEVHPQSFTDLLVSLHQQYQLPPIYITENGIATEDCMKDGEVIDTQRIHYFQRHLQALHEAIEQGVDIRGYFAWSLLDNFEWAEGYAKRFGLIYVDYKTQERTLKASAMAYRECIRSRAK